MIMRTFAERNKREDIFAVIFVVEIHFFVCKE